MFLNHRSIARGSSSYNLPWRTNYRPVCCRTWPRFFLGSCQSVKVTNLKRPRTLHSAWSSSRVSERVLRFCNSAPFLHTLNPTITTVSPPNLQTFPLRPRLCSGVHSCFCHCFLSYLWPRSACGRCLVRFFPLGLRCVKTLHWDSGGSWRFLWGSAFVLASTERSSW